LIAFLVDTSFLITLADPTRRHHGIAKAYFQEALQRGTPMYMSVIAAAEFQVRQSVTDLPLRNFEVLPFNIDHAMTTGSLTRELTRESPRDPQDDRTAVKDDIKLIAQAVCTSATHVLTEDARTLAKYVQRLNAAGQTALKVVLLADGFDVAWFNGGQSSLPET
jgi:predicted nucleic acid-binding protein